MASSAELIRKRSDYYAFKENVNIILSDLRGSLSAVTAAYNKVLDTYTLDGESLDKGKLQAMRDKLESHCNTISSRTLPAIDSAISKLSTQIEQALAAEAAKAARAAKKSKR